jgi:uncharacterized protein with NRDE domain
MQIGDLVKVLWPGMTRHGQLCVIIKLYNVRPEPNRVSESNNRGFLRCGVIADIFFVSGGNFSLYIDRLEVVDESR